MTHPISTKVVPSLRESISYWFLRPFLSDVPVDQIPGCLPKGPLKITRIWHSDLIESLVPIPSLNPGDSIWMHPQLVRLHIGIELERALLVVFTL